MAPVRCPLLLIREGVGCSRGFRFTRAQRLLSTQASGQQAGSRPVQAEAEWWVVRQRHRVVSDTGSVRGWVCPL